MTSQPFRGMDHIGITIPDIEEATRFLVAAFDAEPIYDSVKRTDAAVEGDEPESILSLAHGTKITAVRMMKLRVGPGIELFEMKGPEQGQAVRPSDFGLQHFALYVDDIEAAIARFEKAGGTMFTGPQPLMFPTETGKGNFFCYGRMPWGTVVEFISLPSPMPYEHESPLRRWRPYT